MDDLISRQAAIDALNQIFDRCEEIEAHLPEGDPDRIGYKMYPDYITVWKYLHQLPSAEPKPWEYDEDCGCVMCRCPKCSRRMTISLYQYKNPYKFCPYCGQALTEGKLAQKRKQVYGEGVRRNDNNQE